MNVVLVVLTTVKETQQQQPRGPISSSPMGEITVRWIRRFLVPNFVLVWRPSNASPAGKNGKRWGPSNGEIWWQQR
ncbi:hypothetical protein TIFTF001_003176 [Ficus carica]|uniref:Uncharacterized protein n=1 Tax=Ficus carica TaxID=3494 RepID=A0AA88CTP4_FICCA|nr:hypothetical protein TIFTF001_003176 [Ficus carica]